MRAAWIAALLTTAFAGPAAPTPAAAAPGRVAAAVSGTMGALFGVTAMGARSAWAVGAGGADPFGAHSPVLILRWNGAAWTPVPVPRFRGASSQRQAAVR
jgi:hypothetical protein